MVKIISFNQNILVSSCCVSITLIGKTYQRAGDWKDTFESKALMGLKSDFDDSFGEICLIFL